MRKMTCFAVEMIRLEFLGTVGTILENMNCCMPSWREKATLIRETISVWSIKDKMRRGCATGNRSVTEKENTLAELLKLNNPDVHGQAISLFILLTRHSQHNRWIEDGDRKIGHEGCPNLAGKHYIRQI